MDGKNDPSDSVQFPPEIFQQIVSFLHGEMENLKRLSLTSRIFVPFAQSLLFQTVSIYSKPALIRLSGIMRESPHICHIIRCLEIHLDMMDVQRDGDEGSCALIHILESSREIERLEFSPASPIAVNWDDDISPDLKGSLASLLARLTVQSVSLNRIVRLPLSIFQAIGSLHSLELREISLNEKEFDARREIQWPISHLIIRLDPIIVIDEDGFHELAGSQYSTLPIMVRFVAATLTNLTFNIDQNLTTEELQQFSSGLRELKNLRSLCIISDMIGSFSYIPDDIPRFCLLVEAVSRQSTLDEVIIDLGSCPWSEKRLEGLFAEPSWSNLDKILSDHPHCPRLVCRMATHVFSAQSIPKISAIWSSALANGFPRLNDVDRLLPEAHCAVVGGRF